MLSDVFVHFKLWIDERERIVPRCRVPAKAKVKFTRSCNTQKKKGLIDDHGDAGVGRGKRRVGEGRKTGYD